MTVKNIIPLDEHTITYYFRGIRAYYKCSCGKVTKPGADTILGAERKAKAHLTQVGGDLTQPYRSGTEV